MYYYYLFEFIIFNLYLSPNTKGETRNWVWMLLNKIYVYQKIVYFTILTSPKSILAGYGYTTNYTVNRLLKS